MPRQDTTGATVGTPGRGGDASEDAGGTQTGNPRGHGRGRHRETSPPACPPAGPQLGLCRNANLETARPADQRRGTAGTAAGGATAGSQAGTHAGTRAGEKEGGPEEQDARPAQLPVPLDDAGSLARKACTRSATSRLGDP